MLSETGVQATARFEERIFKANTFVELLEGKTSEYL